MIDAAFEALWKSVLDRWDEERAHRAFLAYCQTTDQLAEAAARYRGMKGDRDRSGVAQQRLNSIAVIALAQLEATRTRLPRPGRSLAVVATVFALTAVGLMIRLLLSR